MEMPVLNTLDKILTNLWLDAYAETFEITIDARSFVRLLEEIAPMMRVGHVNYACTELTIAMPFGPLRVRKKIT